MKIVFLPEALEYFNELSTILYEKEYFGFEESALGYVNELLDEIKISLPTKVKKPAPPLFNRYGINMLYATFPKNKSTQWYVFFNMSRHNGETIAFVRYISNNYMIAQFL